MNHPITYLWSQQRIQFIKTHLFVYDEAKRRILSQFNNIEDEATEIENKYLSEGSSHYYYNEIDPSSIYEDAFEKGYEYYDLLSNMKIQVQLNTLSLIFHHWNTTLRDWLAKELSHSFKDDFVEKIAYSQNIKTVYDFFNELDWSVELQPFFKKLDAMRLIVNIYKHGNGKSLEDLRKNYPQYLNKEKTNSDFFPSLLQHSDLKVTEEHIDEFSDSIISFWQNIPEYLYLKKEA